MNNYAKLIVFKDQTNLLCKNTINSTAVPFLLKLLRIEHEYRKVGPSRFRDIFTVAFLIFIATAVPIL